MSPKPHLGLKVLQVKNFGEEPQRSQAPPLPMKKRGAAVGQLYWWLPRFPSGCTTILGELRMQRGMNKTDSTVNKSTGWFAIRLYTKSKALSTSWTQCPAGSAQLSTFTPRFSVMLVLSPLNRSQASGGNCKALITCVQGPQSNTAECWVEQKIM